MIILVGKFSIGQLERASEILGNISVAWFSAGIISPLFAQPKSLSDFLFTLGISLAMTAIFALISLSLAKGANQ